MNTLKIFTLPLIMFSCISKYPCKWEEKGITPKTLKSDLIIKKGTKNLKVIYTGCGGLALDNGEEVVLTDPYFSNNPFMTILLGKVSSNPTNIKSAFEELRLNQIEPERIKHILIGHSHYDHLLDVPFILEKKLVSDSVKVYGSRSAYNAINSFIKNSSFINVSSTTIQQQFNGNIASWIYLSKRIRFLPIKGDHAPHFLGIHLMKGEIDEKGIKGFKNPDSQSYAPHWKRGEVFSFLIDFLDEGEIGLRVFIQGSSCLPPAAFPPQEEIRKRKVDLAFLGVASSTNIKDYPTSILKYLEPEKVVLIHWEDFFRSYFEKPKTVRLTNFNKFFKRVGKVYGGKPNDQLSEKILMPKPRTVLNVVY